MPSRLLSEQAGGEVFLKAENLQRTGSFKVRGAAAKLASLTPKQRARGVIAASAGNHAQGVALAAQRLGIPCTIVMPIGASIAKMQATRGYGATVLSQGDNLDGALEHAQALALERGLALVHPYDDPLVIAGQGTLGLELAEEMPDLDVVVVPVGGGGLIAGVAMALKETGRGAHVIGVQAAAASGGVRSFHAGRRVRMAPGPTLADGIAVSMPGSLAFPLIRRYVDQMVTVSEEAIAHAQVFLLERAKLLVEGAGAVGVAALLDGQVPASGRRLGVVLSGGNVDMPLLDRILAHGLAEAGRYRVVRMVVVDQPGQLARLLAVVARKGANILSIEHQRHALHLSLGQVEVELTLETRDRNHGDLVVRALAAAGYPVTGEDAAAATS
jgi:threonine dehydratase